MISKEERERDKLIAERVTRPLPWVFATSNSHRRILSEGSGHVAFGTKQRDGTDDIAIANRDGEHLVNAANRLPAYIADAEEMERRLAALDRAIEEERASGYKARLAGLLEARNILQWPAKSAGRGEP